METTPELSDRKREILTAVVNEYINTSKPVSSKSIAANTSLGVSAATVRNEMSELAKMGYLEQPHTSAGRVPSPAAYRLYVNYLLYEQQLSVSETKEINDALRKRLAELDAMIADLSQIISGLASHPAFSLLRSRAYLNGAVNVLDRPEYDEIEKARQLLAYIDDSQASLPPASNLIVKDSNNKEDS